LPELIGIYNPFTKLKFITLKGSTKAQGREKAQRQDAILAICDGRFLFQAHCFSLGKSPERKPKVR
jgi:hypothetical protein